MMKACLLFALLLLTSSHASEKAAEGMLRNRAEVEVDVHGHRELWSSGFSWTNLLCTLSSSAQAFHACPW
jgi:hypothetical protein